MSQYPQNPEKLYPGLSLEWHRYLVKFLIWFWIVVCFIYSATLLFPWIQNSLDFVLGVDEVVFGPVFPGPITLAFAAGFLFEGAFLLKVRHDLKRMRRKAPKELSVAFLIAFWLHGLVFLASVLQDSIRFWPLLLVSGIAYVNSLFPAVASLAARTWYRRYYNTLDLYFMN